MGLPELSLIDLKECGNALGTVCAELNARHDNTLAFIDQPLVNLVSKLAGGQDTRRAIIAHLNGYFSQFCQLASEAAADDAYMHTHFNSIKAPFSIN